MFSSFSFFKQDLLFLFKHLGGLPVSLKQCNADLFCLQNNNQDEVLTTWMKSGSSAIEKDLGVALFYAVFTKLLKKVML